MEIKICLINLLQDGETAIDDGNDETVIPNMGTGYIAGALEKEGFKTDIFDCNIMALSMEEVIKLVVKKEYTVIGVASFAYNVSNMNYFVNKVHESLPTSFIYIGGYYATLNFEYALYANKNISCCMIGEGEKTTVELIKSLQDEIDWHNIAGIAYLENNRVKRTEKRNLIKNLDDIPLPKRPLIKNHTTSLLTSRGCYGSCIYCCLIDFTNTCIGAHIRYRSVDNVMQEIDKLVLENKVEFLQINDDNFLISSQHRREWLLEFIEKLKSRNYKIKFFIYARANDIIDQKDVLGKLKEVGLQQVFIGIESFVQRQLDFYKKRVKTDDNIKAFKILGELDIPIIMGFLMFEPNTKLEEIIENLTVLKYLEFEKYLWYEHMLISSYPSVIPYTGTPLYKYLLDNKLFVNNLIGYEFVDSRVGYLYHDLIKQWNELTSPIISSLEDLLKKQDNNVTPILKRIKMELLKSDVDFLLEVSNKILDEDLGAIDSVIDLYSKVLDNIKIKISNVK